MIALEIELFSMIKFKTRMQPTAEWANANPTVREWMTTGSDDDEEPTNESRRSVSASQ
jgi:hypothetical protein